jgi:hypothetical protein
LRFEALSLEIFDFWGLAVRVVLYRKTSQGSSSPVLACFISKGQLIGSFEGNRTRNGIAAFYLNGSSSFTFEWELRNTVYGHN